MCTVQCAVCCMHCPVSSVQRAACSVHWQGLHLPVLCPSNGSDGPIRPTRWFPNYLLFSRLSQHRPKKRWHLIGNLLGLRGQWTWSAGAARILLTNVSSNVSFMLLIFHPHLKEEKNHKIENYISQNVCLLKTGQKTPRNQVENPN